MESSALTVSSEEIGIETEPQAKTPRTELHQNASQPAASSSASSSDSDPPASPPESSSDSDSESEPTRKKPRAAVLRPIMRLILVVIETKTNGILHCTYHLAPAAMIAWWVDDDDRESEPRFERYNCSPQETVAVATRFKDEFHKERASNTGFHYKMMDWLWGSEACPVDERFAAYSKNEISRVTCFLGGERLHSVKWRGEDYLAYLETTIVLKNY